MNRSWDIYRYREESGAVNAEEQNLQNHLHKTMKILSVTIRTKNAYHYLYFPDDGSTTRRHHGGQEFMKRGAEKKQSKIIDRIMQGLTSKFEEGAK